MANPTDTIQLKLPMTLDAETRASIIRQHSKLLSILNGPDADAKGKSLAAAKKAARQGMHALRERIAKLGGRVDINMPSEQTDPTTGEITTRKVKETVAPGGHTLTFDVGKGKDTQSGRAATAATTMPPDALATPTVPPAPISIPSMPSPFLPVGPGAPAEAAAPTPARPTVPDEMGDLNADPFLAGLPAEAAPESPATPGISDTPEMARLRALINEPSPNAPTGELTTGQKIAYGFLAGMLGIEKVMPLVHEQKAEAVQRFLMNRQERENLIKNLTQLVGLQSEQQTRQMTLERQLQERQELLQSRLVTIHDIQGKALSYHQTAQTAIQALQVDPDPTLQVRAQDLINQGAALGEQAKMIDQLQKTNPEALVGSEAPIQSFANAATTYKESVDKALAELEARGKMLALPDAKAKLIDDLKVMLPNIDSAIRLVSQGVGGPVAGTWQEWFPMLAQPEAEHQYGVLKGVLATVEQMVRSIGPGANISQVEREIFGGMLLSPRSTKSFLLGELEALRAWHQMKLQVATGKASQSDADRILLRMEDGITDDPASPGKNDPILGVGPHGSPVWHSRSGIDYELTEGDY